MNFQFSEELELIAASARDFASSTFDHTLWSGMNRNIFQKMF